MLPLWLVAWSLVGLASVSAQEPSAAEPAGKQAVAGDKLGQRMAELLERIRELEGRNVEGALSVSGPLVTAKVALERLRLAWAHGDEALALRAERIVRASLALAERRHSLLIEQGLKQAAVARREQARERAQVSQAAREAEARLLQERSLNVQTTEAPGPTRVNP